MHDYDIGTEWRKGHTWKVDTTLILGKKRKRCGTCSGCTSEDCKFCKDNPRYGGPGKKKQCCIHRQCTQLQEDKHSMSAVLQEQSVTIAQLKQHMAHIVLSPRSTINLVDNAVVPPPNTEEYNSVTCCLQQQDRMIDYIIGDGNCMFRSFSKELFGTQYHHLQLRKLIVDFEEHNPNIIMSLFNGDVQQLLDRMRQESEWRSATELVALAAMLQIPVYRFTNSASHTYTW